MSVDTYLKGKNTSSYRKLEPIEGVTILIAPKLTTYVHKIELVTRKKLVGSKLIAIAHHEDTSARRP